MYNMYIPINVHTQNSTDQCTTDLIKGGNLVLAQI